MYDANRLKASEREALMRMALAEDFLLKNKRDLDNRLMRVHMGHNRISVLCSKIRNLNLLLYETVPREQMESFHRNIQSVGYTIGVMRPGEKTSNDDFGLWLSFNTINTLVAALKDHCLMCGKDTIQQRQCPLQKALDEIGNDLRDDGRPCKYRGVI